MGGTAPIFGENHPSLGQSPPGLGSGSPADVGVLMLQALTSKSIPRCVLQFELESCFPHLVGHSSECTTCVRNPKSNKTV